MSNLAALGYETPLHVQPPMSAQREALLRCASCSVDSLARHGEWAICGCRLAYCTHCFAKGCEACGQASPACDYRPANIDAEGHADYDDMNHDAHQPSSSPPEADFEVGTAMPMPVILSPSDAAQRRLDVMSAAAQQKRERRIASRIAARAQRAAATRPRRLRREDGWTSFATVNVTTSERLKEELTREGELAGCDFLGIQEHALHGDLVTAASAWLKKKFWTGVIDDAYFKSGGHGGGTAAISRHPAGLRRVGTTRSGMTGRCTFSVTQLGTAITFCVFYGISGATVAAQCPLWRQLVDDLLGLGRPFIVAGDWQRHPDDLRSSGICQV